jgi:hypothetical protein
VSTIYLIDRTVKAKPPAGFLTKLSSALQGSVVEFARHWGLDPYVRVLLTSASPSKTPGSFSIVLSDTADVDGALGYHDVNPDGTPVAKVFTKTILDDKGTWSSGANSVSVCVDHEAKEAKLDAPASLWGMDSRGRLWAYEASDAVQSSTFVGVGDIAMSNHLLPSYFAAGAKGPYDKLGRLKTQFSIDRGGYAIVASASGETEQFADAAAMGFDVVADPHGRGSLILDPAYALPAGLKTDGSSRTMRRLAAQQS